MEKQKLSLIQKLINLIVLSIVVFFTAFNTSCLNINDSCSPQGNETDNENNGNENNGETLNTQESNETANDIHEEYGKILSLDMTSSLVAQIYAHPIKYWGTRGWNQKDFENIETGDFFAKTVCFLEEGTKTLRVLSTVGHPTDNSETTIYNQAYWEIELNTDQLDFLTKCYENKYYDGIPFVDYIIGTTTPLYTTKLTQNLFEQLNGTAKINKLDTQTATMLVKTGYNEYKFICFSDVPYAINKDSIYRNNRYFTDANVEVIGCIGQYDSGALYSTIPDANQVPFDKLEVAIQVVGTAINFGNGASYDTANTYYNYLAGNSIIKAESPTTPTGLVAIMSNTIDNAFYKAK